MCPCALHICTALSAICFSSIFLVARIEPLHVMSTFARQSCMRPAGARTVVNGSAVPWWH